MSELGRHHHRIGGVELAVCIFAATGSRRTLISRAVGNSLMSRGSDAAAPVAVILANLVQTRIHYRYRCCAAMRSRAETRYRCL